MYAVFTVSLPTLFVPQTVYSSDEQPAARDCTRRRLTNARPPEWNTVLLQIRRTSRTRLSTVRSCNARRVYCVGTFSLEVLHHSVEEECNLLGGVLDHASYSFSFRYVTKSVQQCFSHNCV